jgi:hypothetical protein
MFGCGIAVRVVDGRPRADVCRGWPAARCGHRARRACCAKARAQLAGRRCSRLTVCCCATKMTCRTLCSPTWSGRRAEARARLAGRRCFLLTGGRWASRLTCRTLPSPRRGGRCAEVRARLPRSTCSRLPQARVLVVRLRWRCGLHGGLSIEWLATCQGYQRLQAGWREPNDALQPTAFGRG